MAGYAYPGDGNTFIPSPVNEDKVTVSVHRCCLCEKEIHKDIEFFKYAAPHITVCNECYEKDKDNSIMLSCITNGCGLCVPDNPVNHYRMVTKEELSGFCSQCGQSLESPACGPTHALLASEQTKEKS